MIIYSHTITSRLRYITGFIGKEITGKPFILTTDSVYFNDYPGPKINYSDRRISNEELLIINAELLFEDAIRQQDISLFGISAVLPGVQTCKAFFKTGGDFPFDIFAASFYLLSRYEEYLPHEKDMYGRYAHQNSLAFKEKFLDQPLVNIWLKNFEEALKKKFPSFTIDHPPFTFRPTYDIDEAYAFRGKGFLRAAAGFSKAIMSGQWSMAKERWRVIRGKSNDPYDAYEWIDRLHEKYSLKPVYFFHVAPEKGRYDKNISPSQPLMQQLVKQHAEKYSIGIHPSWKSGDKESLPGKEIQILESVSGKKISSSRQHYIRLTLPHTFRRLIAAGIKKDYSMGYGSINGFRASVASPFYWYDLEKEEQTDLLLYPFCYMEANSFFEQKFTASQALEEMMHYYKAVKSVNGMLITIWHNSFLGTATRFAGWKEVYEQFLHEVCR